DHHPNILQEHRYLTLEGRRVARAVGRKLREKNIGFELVLTSPLVRAVQTAELICEAVDYTGVIEALGVLAPEVPPRAAATEIATRGDGLAIFGHEPNLSTLGAILINRPSFPPFKPGQVSLVEDGKGVWTLDPKTLDYRPLLTA